MLLSIKSANLEYFSFIKHYLNNPFIAKKTLQTEFYRMIRLSNEFHHAVERERKEGGFQQGSPALMAQHGLPHPTLLAVGAMEEKKGVSAALMAQHGLPHPTLLAVGAMEKKKG